MSGWTTRSACGQRGVLGTASFVCRNPECPSCDTTYDVATVSDAYGSYVDGETACPNCGEEGEELD